MFQTLLLLAHLYTGLPTPDTGNFKQLHDNLVVEFLPAEVMEKRVCGGVGLCDGTNLAAYRLGTNNIIVTDVCDNKYDVYCHAVILHEMVHFLQYINGRYYSFDRGALASIRYCSKLISNEAEAYTVQRRFLQNQGVEVEWTVEQALKHYQCNVDM